MLFAFDQDESYAKPLGDGDEEMKGMIRYWTIVFRGEYGQSID